MRTHHLTEKRQKMHKIAIRSTSIALALGTLSSVALAEPVQLTEAEMDQVTAGAFEWDGSTNTLHDRPPGDPNRHSYVLQPGATFGTDADGNLTVVAGTYISDHDGFVWGVHRGMAPDGLTYDGIHYKPGNRASGYLVLLSTGELWGGGL
jgi:hypothetical protein